MSPRPPFAGPGGETPPPRAAWAEVQASAPVSPFLTSPALTNPAPAFGAGLGFTDAVVEVQQRVAARLSADGARYANLSADAKRLRTQSLVYEELESWVAHRAQVGLSILTDSDEDDLVAAVLAALGGLGPLEPLLHRTDIEDIFFNGTYPTMLRLANGEMVEGPPLASSDAQLSQLLQSMAASPLDDSAGREFSVSRPLLQLRMKSVGLLGARMSAAMDVTPHPAGTIRVHRHVETSLPQLKDLGMIDEALRVFLTAVVLAGGKIMVSGATGVGIDEPSDDLVDACRRGPTQRPGLGHQTSPHGVPGREVRICQRGGVAGLLCPRQRRSRMPCTLKRPGGRHVQMLSCCTAYRAQMLPMAP